MNIFWFRRDLRVDDNKGFFEALSSNSEVLPIFIFVYNTSSLAYKNTELDSPVGAKMFQKQKTRVARVAREWAAPAAASAE